MCSSSDDDGDGDNGDNDVSEDYGVPSENRFWSQTSWVQLLVPSLTNYVVLSKCISYIAS